MDIRYNIIQWVHRYTRGWSYGAAVVDPRTGEIIKGNVTLGSLRGRQDYLIAEALLSPYVDGKPLPPANDPMLAMVLAAHPPARRARNRPHPRPRPQLRRQFLPALTRAIRLRHGLPASLDHARLRTASPDLSPRLRRQHRRLGQGLHQLRLSRIRQVRQAHRRPTPHSTTSSPTRRSAASSSSPTKTPVPLGSAHPHSHLWDNGADPADELNRILTVRTAALARFGENAIKPGTPLAQLEDTLVPLYLLHRYQTEAAIKEIGGLDYRYNLRGDGQPIPEIVSAAEQKKALAAVLKTLSPETLTLPESLLKILPPRPPGLDTHPRVFPI